MIWFLFLGLCFSSSCFGQEQVPKILVDAPDFHGFPDAFTFLKVQTNTVPGATYAWKKDEQLITKDTYPKFEQYDTTRLFAVNKGKEYAGTYQIVMESPSIGKITGRKISVDFTYLGEFDKNLPKEINVDLVVGQAHFIKCPKHTKGSNIIYKWGKSSDVSGTKFMESKENYIVLDSGTLFYSHLTQSDVKLFNENEWTCGMEGKVGDNNQFRWADNVKTVFNVKSSNMTEFGPRIVTTLPQDKSFQEGHTITMKCAAAGRPTPKYSWERVDVYGNRFVLEDSKDGITFDDGDTRLLVIKLATRNHAGKYFCTATIGDKNHTVEGSLSFEVKPSWVSEKQIESKKPSIYSNHSWTCNATGFPMPTYKWFKNGIEISSSPTHQINEGSITFPKLEKSDTAMYECVAENRVDNIYQTAYLDVQAEKPVFDTNTGKETLFLGGKGVIKCKAKAAPAAKNTWRKDGVDIDFSIPRYTLQNSEDLVIDSVSKQDVGNYTCTATNLYGADTLKISVQVVGEITFIQEPQNVNTTRGTRATLYCEAEGDKDSPFKATIKYKWEFNGKQLAFTNDIVWSESGHALNLFSPQVSNSGTYACIAYIDQPSYAEKKREAVVKIKGPPEAPNKVKVDGGCDKFSAKLLWHIQSNNYEPIQYLIIQMAMSYGDAEWHNISERVAPNVDEKTIKNLSPWTQYRFRVLAINKIGTSAPSEPTQFKECRTPAAAPERCPKIRAIPGKADELTLKWEEFKPIDQNGEGFRYVLEYSSAELSYTNTKSFPPVETEFKIPNAGYYRLWEFKIRGQNNFAAGPNCTGRSYSGQDAPNKAPEEFLVDSILSTSVVLKWKALSLDRGSVDGYKLTYYPVKTSRKRSLTENCDQKNPCEKDITNSADTKYELDGLLAYTRYSFSLRGYNSGGLGPKSTTSAKTAQDKPGIPYNIRATPYGKYIKLEWEEPRQPNGIITGYKVSIDQDANPRSKELGASARKYVFGGLKPTKKYYLYIQAKTNNVYGEKDTVPVTTLALQAPAKPKKPVLKAIGEDGVNVTFIEGKPVKGFPEKFIVLYRIKDGDNDTWLETGAVPWYGPDSTPFHEITGLDRTKKYEMKTVAVNGDWRSEASDVETVTPGIEIGIAPKQGTDPVYKRSWFVAIVVIVCFLLIILLIALLVTRKRGERYPVGKREKKRAGILDVGEEPDLNQYPMKPPRHNGNGVSRQDSGGSLPNKDPDRDSLDEYGEDRFDEDAASLIGAYNDDRKANKYVDEPEFV